MIGPSNLANFLYLKGAIADESSVQQGQDLRIIDHYIPLIHWHCSRILANEYERTTETNEQQYSVATCLFIAIFSE